jgi:drug/metabolite transporter (DMT)-like permease
MEVIWLIGSIILSTAFGQIMKWAVVRRCSTAQVAAVNYVIATATAAAVGYFARGLHFDLRILAIGLLGGVSYAVAIVSIFHVIRAAGIGITGTLMRLAVMGPVLGGIFLFNEMPTLMQWIGIGLTLISFFLLRPAAAPRGGPSPPVERGRIGWLVLLNMALLVVTLGAGFLAWKMVPFYGCAGESWEFLCLLFGIPTLTCAAESGVRREGVLGAAIVIGVILGVTNVLSVSASLQGLRTIPSVLFFPVYSCGGVLLNALAAVVLWRERLTRLNGIGIAVVCLALVFMNPGR